MKKLFLSVVVGSLLMMSSLHAQVMTYTGSDEYIMSEFETIDIAKQRAEQKAIRNAQEQAGVYVESNTQVVNMMITKDEIRTMTAGILKVTDVQYQLTPLEGGKSLIVKASVNAVLDTVDFFNYNLNQRKEVVQMAYVPSTAGAKKGVKLAMSLPGDTSTTRSYFGLNMGTGGNTAIAGPSFSNALSFFASAVSNLTNATLEQQFITTEQEYAWQE